MSNKKMKEIIEHLKHDNTALFAEGAFQYFMDNQITEEELIKILETENYSLPESFFSLSRGEKKLFFNHTKLVVGFDISEPTYDYFEIFNKNYFYDLAMHAKTNKELTRKLIDYVFAVSNGEEGINTIFLGMQYVKLDKTNLFRYDSLKNYDRGVAWSQEDFSIKGQQWKAAYLPVWLYSYQEVKGDKKLLHYVAVNARTGETMGSVPIHMPKLIAISALVEALGVFLMFLTADDFEGSWIFLSIGIIYFIIMYSRYRNAGARHTYETETEREVTNLRQVDKYIKRRNGLSNSTISGANNTNVNGATAQNKLLKNITNSIPGASAIVDEFTKNDNK